MEQKILYNKTYEKIINNNICPTNLHFSHQLIIDVTIKKGYIVIYFCKQIRCLYGLY